MKMYPIEKYRYYTADNGRKTIAVSTYAGKTVRGVAVCHPDDTYDPEMGRKIAAARCAIRIAQKRSARAEAKMIAAEEAISAAESQYDKMVNYFDDAQDELYAAYEHLHELLGEL